MTTEKNENKVVEIQNKFGKQDKLTAGGVEYTFQFPGTRKSQEILDMAKGPAGKFNDTVYNEQLMEHVIVAPKTNWDYWDEHDGYREVMDAADRFLGSLL